jgi:hypothetical protein
LEQASFQIGEIDHETTKIGQLSQDLARPNRRPPGRPGRREPPAPREPAVRRARRQTAVSSASANWLL